MENAFDEYCLSDEVLMQYMDAFEASVGEDVDDEDDDDEDEDYDPTDDPYWGVHPQYWA